jgi:hypothetical protein
MPRVPDASGQEEKNPITGDQFVAPENLLVAAAHMNDMGRLFEHSGHGKFAGLRGHKARPMQSLKAK